jgi:hypothetical protein
MWATDPSAPAYSLSIVEGETTLPEYQIVSTSGHVQPSAEVGVSIIRNGTVVARSTGKENTWMSQVPEVGDLVTLETPLGTTVGAFVYDGLPSIAATVCAGSASFSGQRSEGQAVEGGAFTLALETDPYGTNVRETAFSEAQVTALSGSTFGGSFLAPLALGQTVYASESLKTPLAGGATFTYSSENERPVGACPPVPVVAPPPPPPPPPALEGSILKLVLTNIRNLIKHGWSDRVTINQPGTVIQDLYLQSGALPAFASSRGKTHHAKKPAAMLLARGTVTATSAGTVEVVLRVNSRARRKLEKMKSVKAVLVTTLRSASGTKLDLGRRSVSFHR